MVDYSIKKYNRKIVYQLIYQAKQITKQEIAERLKLSLPTVSSNLLELEQADLIKKEDINESTGGRKPLAISIKEESRIAIGVSILKEGITFVALDLYAQLIRKQTVALVYDNSESYFKQYGQALNEFIDCLQIKKENFLGITIAIQGIVSQDGKKVIYGPILNNQGLTLEKFEKSSDLPVKMIHDSHAAGLAELNFSEDNNDAIYLSLNHNLGSAVFMAGKVFQGNNYSSTFEHMTLVENGRQCYCGKKGCFEAYCNEDALLKNHTNMTLEEFYKQLRQKDQTAMQSWNDYFHYLALAIHNLTMVLDAPVIIGGKIASLFENEDLDLLTKLVSDLDPLKFTVPDIKIGQCLKETAAIGAALTDIKKFVAEI